MEWVTPTLVEFGNDSDRAAEGDCFDGSSDSGVCASGGTADAACKTGSIPF